MGTRRAEEIALLTMDCDTAKRVLNITAICLYEAYR